MHKIFNTRKTAKHFQILLAVLVAMAATAQQGPNCEHSCGNFSIMFPFGSGPGCYYNADFNIVCNRSSGEPRPMFGDAEFKYDVTNMSITMSELEIMMTVSRDCYDSSGVPGEGVIMNLYIWGSVSISAKNKFIAIGCDTQAYFDVLGEDEISLERAGCVSKCDRNSCIANGSCLGVGCCEVPVPNKISGFGMTLSSYNNHMNITDFNPCSFGFLVKEGTYDFSTTDLLNFTETMPMVLDWAIGNETCNIASQDNKNFLCKGKSTCDQSYEGPGYRCRCPDGYEGNPYIENNCTNINECENSNQDCVHECVDTEGSYTCKCRKGYSGKGKLNGSGCTPNQYLIKYVAGASIGVLLLFTCVTWLYFGLKKRKHMLLREKFYKKNGGLMLEQRIADGGFHDQAKVFTIDELKNATNNFDDNMVIGKGGFGTVYKGVLSDKRVVAIKMSKLAANQTESQIEQFINEVVVLSQINHRNIVKLIGCCLETEVPTLVYEFIPNGTLFDHIHDIENSSAMTWDMRLRILMETAEALSYLHSAASVPIIHRDVKSMNILLDDDYVAKLADFGASKLIPMDQTELATIVQGTLGYLDPEYMQTNQLTAKSDVYSFGVVVVELLTGKKALSLDRPGEERNLAMYFLSSLKRERLFHILDENLQLNEVPYEIIQILELAERCLNYEGDKRPSMKEVSIELQGMLASTVHRDSYRDEGTTEVGECLASPN